MSVRIAAGLLVMGLFVIVLIGCEPPGPVASQGVLAGNANSSPGPPLPPPPPPEVPLAESPAPEAGEANPVDQTIVAASEPSADAGQPTYTPAEPKSAAAKPAIRLSAGLALPQTLPDGTQVGVSVDYKVTGELNKAAQYLWVVQSQKGETAMEAQLKSQGGNLASFLPIEVRPDDGPFKARIEEVSTSGGRVLVSNVEPLK